MNDDAIIQLYLRRSEDAIAETEAAYGRSLHSLAVRILDSPEDAEESVNDTYLKAWNTIPPQRPSHFFGYLAKLCRFASLDKLDWRSAAKRSGGVVSLTQEMETCIPDESRDRELEGRELGRVLNAFLENLPRESRVIFLRRYWYADTVAEIAQRYAVSESKVKTQLHRTRKKLSDYLKLEGITV